MMDRERREWEKRSTLDHATDTEARRGRFVEEVYVEEETTETTTERELGCSAMVAIAFLLAALGLLFVASGIIGP